MNRTARATAMPSRQRGWFRAPVTGGIVSVALVSLLLFDTEQRIIAMPLYAVTATVVMLFAILWERDNAPPYFDLGVICVVTTFMYVAYPLCAYLLAGLDWTELSDNRLVAAQTTPSEFAQVAWWANVYLVALAVSYLAVRRYPAVDRSVPLEVPNRTSVMLMLGLYVSTFLFLQLIQIVFNVDLNPTYGNDARTSEALPLILQQISNKVGGISIVAQFALIVLLVKNSDQPEWRWTLIVWAVAQLLIVVLVFGARSSMVFFALAWLLAHQRLRQPLRPMTLLTVGSAIVVSALLYGLARDIGNRGYAGDSLFSANNEFQALYATAYDILRSRTTGTLGDIPWQLYFADLFRLIPQQLLPFEKVDPSQWYLDLLGLRGTGQGFMFGVTSEAAIGFGILEMAVRGALVGAIFGGVHNWYCRNAFRFWPTVFYIWLCVWSYYTYRASTFYLLTHILFVFLPTYFVIRILSNQTKPALPASGVAASQRRS